MDNLTEEEKEEIRRMLNTLNTADVCLVALQMKYGKEWHERKVEELEEIEECFSEVVETLRLADRTKTANRIDTQRKDVVQMRKMFEKAVEDFEEIDDEPRKHSYYLT